MVYVFESRSGHQIEREFPMGKAPRALKVRGCVYRRIISGVAFKSLPQPPTESERQMMMEQKHHLERHADDVRDGLITIKHGKHRERAFDPEIKAKPLGNKRK